MSHYADDARLTQLLIDRATVGLADDERGELDSLLTDQPAGEDASYESTAAAVAIGCMAEMAPLPAALRTRLVADAQPFVQPVTVPFPNAGGGSASTAASSGGGPAIGGWLMAAAAAVVAIIGWWPSIESGDAVGRPVSEVVYQQFVDRTVDAVVVPWSGRVAGYEQVTGDVVWSDAEQTGYMRIVGLTPNDPSIEQYQLWIVDPQRDTHPIDGGVFDVTSSGEVFVPIDAKLNAPAATVFAITLEQPGGVVVSDGPLLVVGARG